MRVCFFATGGDWCRQRHEQLLYPFFFLFIFSSLDSFLPTPTSKDLNAAWCGIVQKDVSFLLPTHQYSVLPGREFYRRSGLRFRVLMQILFAAVVVISTVKMNRLDFLLYVLKMEKQRVSCRRQRGQTENNCPNQTSFSILAYSAAQ